MHIHLQTWNRFDCHRNWFSPPPQVSDKAKENDAQTASILELLHPHFLFTTITLTLCWIMGSVGFYTLSMNAAQLHGDMFLNYALTFLVNMQSAPFLWIVVNRGPIQ